MSAGNGNYESEREKKKKLRKYWEEHTRQMMREGFKPSIVIYVKLSKGEANESQVSFTTHYPGLPAGQAAKALALCAQTVGKKAQMDEALRGPRIILPG
jgi:D-tyrosyl-tRNA(Tyr) deacylase